MDITKRELRANWKSLLLWSLGMAAFIIAGLAKYQGYAEAGDETIEQLLAALPEQFLALFGGRDADLTNMLTFYAILFLYLALLGAAHATLLGAGILAKEEQDKTAEFLYVKPMSRAGIITQKLVAGTILVVGMNLITLILSIVFAEAFNNGESITKEIITLSAGLLLLQMIFLGIGMLVASVVHKPRFATYVATALVLASFVLSVLIDVINELADLRYLTPFKYFDAKVITREGGLNPLYIILSIGIIVCTITASYLVYRKRDLEV